MRNAGISPRRLLPPRRTPRPPPSRWHGDGLTARSVRFALTVMMPVGVGMVVGIHAWLIYAMVTSILASALDTGGSAGRRLLAIGTAGLIVLVGTGIGTLVAGHPAATLIAFAAVGALYALVESIHQSAAAGARFLCLTLAIGALFAPLEALDVPVVAAFVLYAWAVSIAWDLFTGAWRPSTAPSLRTIYLRLRATERKRWVFAVAVAIAVPLAFLTSVALGLHRPYWALIAVVLVLRADALDSRTQMFQLLGGTLLGVVAAIAFGYAMPSHFALLIAMALAALIRWPAQHLHGALGTAALTAFIMLLLELVAGGISPAAHDILERLIDVSVGCVFAVLALVLDRLGQYALARWTVRGAKGPF